MDAVVLQYFLWWPALTPLWTAGPPALTVAGKGCAEDQADNSEDFVFPTRSVFKNLE